MFYYQIQGEDNLGNNKEICFPPVNVSQSTILSPRCIHIWVKMPRKNNGLFDVFFSQTLWLKCALLCLPGTLELDCSWTAPQCEWPQVISLAKSKYLNIFGIFFWQTLNGHYSLTVKAFDLIPKLRARSEYQLSLVLIISAWLAFAFHPDRNLQELSA